MQTFENADESITLGFNTSLTARTHDIEEIIYLMDFYCNISRECLHTTTCRMCAQAGREAHRE